MGMMDRENLRMVRKLVVVTIGMFTFGYALIPIYKHICELTGINILSLTEGQIPGNGKTGGAAALPANSQVDKSRTDVYKRQLSLLRAVFCFCCLCRRYRCQISYFASRQSRARTSTGSSGCLLYTSRCV